MVVQRSEGAPYSNREHTAYTALKHPAQSLVPFTATRLFKLSISLKHKCSCFMKSDEEREKKKNQTVIYKI